jgi:hypothetical protein
MTSIAKNKVTPQSKYRTLKVGQIDLTTIRDKHLDSVSNHSSYSTQRRAKLVTPKAKPLKIQLRTPSAKRPISSKTSAVKPKTP